MRPCGEIRAAVLAAIGALASTDRGPTMREIAQRANVSRAAAKSTLHRLVDAGDVRIARERKVEHRSRAVAEYELAAAQAVHDTRALDEVMSTWATAA